MNNKKEIWRDIPGYEGLYKVSNTGLVKSLSRTIKQIKKGNPQYHILKEILLKPSANKKGYLHLSLRKNGKSRTFRIHRLVMLAFCDNPFNLPQVNHIDGIKKNNNLENLEWCNNSHNLKESYRLGRKRMIGENNGYAKLKAKDVIDIYKMRGKLMQKHIAQIYDITPGNVSAIHTKRNWKQVLSNY